MTVGAADLATAASGGIGQAKPRPESKQTSVDESKYVRLYEQASTRDKRWAKRTAQCESGMDPNALGSGGLYRGAFQFLRETWATSPKSPGGDPIDYSYKTQAVVAIALMRQDGPGHWPVCG